MGQFPNTRIAFILAGTFVVFLMGAFLLRANCGSCGEGGDGGGKRGGPGVGIGVTIDLGGKKDGGEEEEDPFAEPPEGSTRTRSKEKAPQTTVGVPKGGEVVEIDNGENARDVEEPAHHCQGARLLIIVGHFGDRTIQASLQWAQSLQGDNHHLHMIGYPTGGGDREPAWTAPHVPPPAGHRPEGVSDIWPRYKVGKRSKDLNDLIATWRDCCFFEEVMVMFHGSQVGSFRGLIANLPKILNNRPVKKLVVWSCESTDAFYPGTGGAGGERNYRKIAHIVRPKACPCECRPAVCTARGPRGERTQCPTADTAVTILASGVVEGRAAKLGLDPSDGRSPLTTPNGELRQITVQPDGTVQAQFVEAGVEVFDGKRSKTDANLVRESSTRVNPDRIRKDARTQDPGNYDPAKNPYAGPKCCANGDGCQLNPT